MRALSIKQPWADLIASGEKQYEYRPWQPTVDRRPYLGQLLICASAARSTGAFKSSPVGCTLCIVQIDSVRRMHASAMFAWRINLLRRVPQIKVKGRLGLWIPSDELLAAIEESE